MELLVLTASLLTSQQASITPDGISPANKKTGAVTQNHKLELIKSTLENIEFLQHASKKRMKRRYTLCNFRFAAFIKY